MARLYISTFNTPSVAITAIFQKVGKRKPVVGPQKELTFRIPFSIELDVETKEVTSDISAIDAFFNNCSNFKQGDYKLVEDLTELRETFKPQLEKVVDTYKQNKLQALERSRVFYETKELLDKGKSRIDEVVNVIKTEFNRNWFCDEHTKLNIVKNKIFTVSNGGVNLGRYYNKYSYLVFLNGNELDKDAIPSGNGGNYSITGEGVHPVLGKYLETTCCVDSGD